MGANLRAEMDFRVQKLGKDRKATLRKMKMIIEIQP